MVRPDYTNDKQARSTTRQPRQVKNDNERRRQTTTKTNQLIICKAQGHCKGTFDKQKSWQIQRAGKLRREQRAVAGLQFKQEI